MTTKETKEQFEKAWKPAESVSLTFHGVEGYDVYNTSIPFWYRGKEYLFGRVEKRGVWAHSWTRLFENTGKDDWTLVYSSPWYPLEDPNITVIGHDLVMEGTHVRFQQGKIQTYYGYFYRGSDPEDLVYFTTGPDFMKDIRLVQLADDRIGVFSRPRDDKITEKYGSAAMVGFGIINSLDELSDKFINNLRLIDGLFGKDEWGGCNQCYLLDSGKIGVIAHQSYEDKEKELMVYFNTAFVFNPDTWEVTNKHIIATRSSYPAGGTKMPILQDVAFTSGIVMRDDGNVDLYSGISDCGEGRVVVPYPFGTEGKIVSTFSL